MNISVNDWIPVNPDDENSFPKDDAYILVSFENASFVDIARYEQDEEGGAFYPGNTNKSYVSIGMVVNAWRPLPKPYREQEEELKQTNIDRIRKMSAEELAPMLPCPYCDNKEIPFEKIPCVENGELNLPTMVQCRQCCVDWLMSEV